MRLQIYNLTIISLRISKKSSILFMPFGRNIVLLIILNESKKNRKFCTLFLIYFIFYRDRKFAYRKSKSPNFEILFRIILLFM